MTADILIHWRRAWHGLPWPLSYLDVGKPVFEHRKCNVHTVDALFFTVATMFTMPAGGVRPPPLFLYGCSRAQSDAHVTPSAVARPWRGRSGRRAVEARALSWRWARRREYGPGRRRADGPNVPWAKGVGGGERDSGVW
jgi:hypothetical protein